jgi:phosphopentomutase
MLRALSQGLLREAREILCVRKNRKDFAIKPPVKTALEILAQNNIGVYSVGKIFDIFLGMGIKDSVHTNGNVDGEDHIINYIEHSRRGSVNIRQSS